LPAACGGGQELAKNCGGRAKIPSLKIPSFLPARLCPLRGRAADFKVNALVPTRPYAGNNKELPKFLLFKSILFGSIENIDKILIYYNTTKTLFI